jgi:hypothetical protein
MTTEETRTHLWVEHGWSKAPDARKERIRQPERWHAYEHEHGVGLPRWQPHEHPAASDLGVAADADVGQAAPVRVRGGE